MSFAAIGALLAAFVALTPAIDRYRRAALRRCLRDTCDVLNAHGIRYWCDFGTLLGLVREGDLILGDKDVDLCIAADEKPRVMELQAAFATRGYRLTGQGGAAKRLLRILDTRTPFYVDIYPYLREGERLRSVWRSPEEDLPAGLVASLRALEAFGTRVPVPADAHALLLHRYGADYGRPRRNDKGRSRRYNRLLGLWEDVEANGIAIGFVLKRLAKGSS